MTASKSIGVVATASKANALLEAVERSHARDLERVKAGELDARALHFIPSDMAVESTIRLSPASIRARR